MSEAGRIRPGKAIPTHYAGKTFRSRLEADTALLLDALKLPWAYEPHSFLLAGGLHYCPDFFVRDRRLWVESRGYRDRLGDGQIVTFAGRIHDGFPLPDTLEAAIPDLEEATDYLVLGPEEVIFHECRGRFGVESGPAYLFRCGVCRSHSFFALGGWEVCHRDDCAGTPSQPDEKWELGIRAGKIQIGGMPLADWIHHANL